MGNNLKYPFFSNNTHWFIDFSPNSPVSLDGQGSAGTDTGRLDSDIILPDTVPILPIRNAVTFPGTITSLAIGREKSKRLLDDVEINETLIGLVTQRQPKINKPTFKELYKIGSIANVIKILRMPQNQMHMVVHSLTRFEILEPVKTEPYLTAKIRELKVTTRMTKKLKALMVSVKQEADQVIELSPNVPEEASILLDNIEDPSTLADFLAANLNLEISRKQQLLEELDTEKRLEILSMEMANQLEVLELSHKIQGRVKESVDKTQREYFLQEQLKAIQNELGQEDIRGTEISELKTKILKAKMPKKTEQETLRELDRLSKTPSASPDYSVIRTYLDWVCELPWSKQTEDRLDINEAEKILNEDHYDLQKIKKRIVEFLAVRKLNPQGKSPILCFVGPPGVGKTSLGKSIARSMGRKFVRVSLGGIRDEADIRGHRRTYVGALPGKVLQEMRKTGSRNPVFMLDELDKIGMDFRGDPASALLEVLDPEQNNSFTDHYLDQPFDLSNVMFIGTANYMEPVPPALRDRMEVIELPGYTTNEKLQIAKKYLVPRQMEQHGLSDNQLSFKDEALLELSSGYTREAGVRNLERKIGALCRSVATEIAKSNKKRATINSRNLKKILGPVVYESELALRTGIPGVATGLAYTPTGGELLFIESAKMPGKGVFKLTGQIGDVMKESAQAAFSNVKANAAKLKIDTEQFDKNDYHVHVPAGAVPKDGPSAGVAIFISLVSLLTDKVVRPDVAMTGEITLRGLVLPIGGLKEKILAAKQAGIKKVVLPSRNKKDMPDIPEEAKEGIEFKFVNNTIQALKETLMD